jgi:hypothetical protein
MGEHSSIRVLVIPEDVLRHPCDVLVLKHAQGLYGADAAVHAQLLGGGVRPRLPPAGSHEIVETSPTLAAARVLFVGVEQLSDFGYGEIRDFARRAMAILAAEKVPCRHVALTIQGPGYGLDESESFKSELAGIIEAIAQNDYPRDLETLAFVEREPSRARRLAAVLATLLPTGRLEGAGAGAFAALETSAKQTLRRAGYASAAKPKVFVAMPFADEMTDVFHYGIQNAVNAAGYLAERADLSTFTGDVMDWVRARISGARLVVADLTSANPNVYLEVGYAWGKGVPTVLIAKSEDALKFDVRSHRCIVYSSIKDLEDKLTRELHGLLTADA